MPTLDLQVVANENDAEEEHDGDVTTATNLPWMGSARAHAYFGFRWETSGLENGDTITACDIELSVNGSLFDEVDDIHISFQDSADAPAFATSTNDISGRISATTAEWNPTPIDVGTGWQSTGDILASACQVPVDQGAFADGSFIVAVLDGAIDDIANDLRIDSYGQNTSLAPQIHITYTEGGGGGSTILPQMMQHGAIQ